jgi:Leu/Phe-tRNA-protein transferase
VGRCLTVGPSMLTHRPNASRTAKLVELVEEIEARGNQAFVGSILLLHSNKRYHDAASHLPARYRSDQWH